MMQIIGKGIAMEFFRTRICPKIDTALAQSDAEPQQDSDGVTRKDVEGWMRYFNEHAEEFVAAHEAIMRKARKSDSEPTIKMDWSLSEESKRQLKEIERVTVRWRLND